MGCDLDDEAFGVTGFFDGGQDPRLKASAAKRFSDFILRPGKYSRP
jgi:hypothetical protein